MGVAADNELRFPGVFKGLFKIRERLLGKKIYIYGVDNPGKSAIILLAHLDLEVAGFVAREAEAGYCGMAYLGKPIISRGDFGDIADNHKAIVDIYGLEGEALQPFSAFRVVLFDRKLLQGKTLAVYGAGASSREAVALLTKSGISVSGIYDRNKELQGQKIKAVEISSAEELFTKNKETIIVIAIQADEIRREVQKQLAASGFTEIYFYCHRLFAMNLHAKYNGDYNWVFVPACLHYIINRLAGKKIYLYSHDVACLQETFGLLERLGIRNFYPVSDVINDGTQYDGKIGNIYDLAYENPQEILIWSLNRQGERLRKLAGHLGLDLHQCFYDGSGPLLLTRDYALDVHLGYNDSRGIVRISNGIESSRSITIGILGGSTSDHDLYYEASWETELLNIAREKGISLTCLVAATAGNIVAQECMRLIRDLIWQNPDIVVSYSGVNEQAFCVQDHRFAHSYQSQIFEKMASLKSTWFFDVPTPEKIGLGERVEDAALFWCQTEKIMHAVCAEQDIRFHAFLQPYMSTKKQLSRFDEEVKLHIPDSAIAANDVNAAKLAAVVPMMAKLEWFHDMRGIFDDVNTPVYYDYCHVLGEQNRLVARNIWDRLKIEEMFTDE